MCVCPFVLLFFNMMQTYTHFQGERGKLLWLQVQKTCGRFDHVCSLFCGGKGITYHFICDYVFLSLLYN